MIASQVISVNIGLVAAIISILATVITGMAVIFNIYSKFLKAQTKQNEVSAGLTTAVEQLAKNILDMGLEIKSITKQIAANKDQINENSTEIRLIKKTCEMTHGKE